MSAEYPWTKQTVKSTPLGVSPAGVPAKSAADVLRDAVVSIRRHGLAEGTKIETPDGETAIELLSVGDVVVTASGDTQRVTRIRSWVSEENSASAPVVLQAGVFGNTDTLRMVPTQKIVLSGYDVEMYFGCDEAELCASDLVDLGIASVENSTVTYFEITLEDAEPIVAAGLAVETPACPRRNASHEDAQSLTDFCARIVLRADEMRLIASTRAHGSVPVH